MTDTLPSPADAGAIPAQRTLPALHIPDDPQHGVTVYARRLAEQLTASGARSHPVGSSASPLHLHFTDRLWGADPAAAATAIERLADGRAVTVTLHDLPQPSDGERSLARRADCYRRVVRSSTGVVCNSEHEATLLLRYVDPGARPAVIPLPVETPRRRRPHHRSRHAVVSVLGFVYPGKGHEAVLRAAARLLPTHPGIRVEALGRPSHGHEADALGLAELARDLGVGFEITGFLTDAEMLERVRRSVVPVIAHEHVSASGSLASWLEAGRRPLVVRSRYMEEMAALHLGAVTLVPPEDLHLSIGAALAEPDSTWLDESVRLGPDLAGTAESYRRFWTEALA